MIPEGIVPEGMKWCIAGGFAAAPALANDIDVWIYDVEEIAPGDIEFVRNELAKQLRVKFGLYNFTPSDETRTSSNYSQENVTILKVGVLEDPMGLRKPIHIMVTNANSPMGILDGFDISTHAVAILPDGTVLQHPHYTPPQQFPQTMRWNEKTPERLKRIAKRFGHEKAA